MSATSPVWNARRTELELPEEVDLQVEVANVGSRTLAILVDLALGGLILFITYGGTILLFPHIIEQMIVGLGAFAMIKFLVVLFVGFQLGYFNFFEWLWNGQTPGKRLLSLRVIKVDGSPVSGIDVFLRNLSRPIDSLLIGLIMIFISRKGQRLGDLMGRTLVIHETKIDWSIFDLIETGAKTTRPDLVRPVTIHLTSSQWELLHRYLNRRDQLQGDARKRLAQSLHDSLKPVAKGTDLERSTLSAEEWLVELARRT